MKIYRLNISLVRAAVLKLHEATHYEVMEVWLAVISKTIGPVTIQICHIQCLQHLLVFILPTTLPFEIGSKWHII